MNRELQQSMSKLVMLVLFAIVKISPGQH